MQTPTRPCLLGLMLCAALVPGACDGSDPILDQESQDPGDHEPPAGAVTEIVQGLSHPWGIAFLPGGEILVTERPGRVRLVRGGELVPQPVAGAPNAVASGQGGMLDLVLHPDFASNAFVYISYSKAVAGGLTTAVARARWDGVRLVDLTDVFVADAAVPGGRVHYGSRIVFDRDGLMYVTVGDRGQGEPAQDLSNHMGTTVRLRDDGSVPPDNPFVGEAGAREEIFSYGHRNPQGIAVHPGTGEIWVNEHGPMGGDELNRLVAGGNYGWPEYSFGDHYTGEAIPDPGPTSGTQLPVTHWTPAVAPSGLTFYSGDRFPEWRDSAFLGTLVGEDVRRVVLEGTDVVREETLLAGYGARIRTVREGPDGYLYFLTDAPNGVLARFAPEGR